MPRSRKKTKSKKFTLEQFLSFMFQDIKDTNLSLISTFEYHVINNYCSNIINLVDNIGDGNCWLYCLIISSKEIQNTVYEQYTNINYKLKSKSDISNIVYHFRKLFKNKLLHFRNDKSNFEAFLNNYSDPLNPRESNIMSNEDYCNNLKKNYDDLVQSILPFTANNQRQKYYNNDDVVEKTRLILSDEFLAYQMLCFFFGISIEHYYFPFNHKIHKPRKTSIRASGNTKVDTVVEKDSLQFTGTMNSQLINYTQDGEIENFICEDGKQHFFFIKKTSSY